MDHRIKVLFKTFRKQQIIIIILSILMYTILAYITFNIQYLFDYGTAKNYDKLTKLVIRLVILFVTMCIINYVQMYRWKDLTFEAIGLLRTKVFSGLLKKDYTFFMNNSSGELLSKVMNDVIMYAQVLSISWLMLFINSYRVVVVIIAMLFISVKVTLIVCMVIPSYYFVYRALNKKIRKVSLQEREEYAKILEDALEKTSAFEVIKLNKKESLFAKNFQTINKNYLGVRSLLNKLLSLGTSLSLLLNDLIPLFTLIIGFYFVSNNDLSVGELISLYAFIPFLIEPLVNLTDHSLAESSSLGMEERIKEFIEKEEVEVGSNLSSIESIEFDNVTFGYDDTVIFNNLSITINKGDRVGIIGATGEGKSTFFKLATGLISPTLGRVLVNGIDINEVNIGSMYDLTSFLPQNPFIFADSVRNNITLYDKYSEDQIENAIEMARAKEVINALPTGIEHIIKEVGKDFSGGEKQRISLARAILKEAELMIFDEPTSAVDAECEELIVSAVGDYLSKKPDNIFMVVTHKEKILEICTRIIKVENSNVVE